MSGRLTPRSGPPLAEVPDLPPLLRRWLAGGDPLLGDPAAAARGLVASPPPPLTPPFWEDAARAAAWRDALLVDCPGRARAAVAAAADRVAAGGALLVVTGQQPGTLGGPLYSLWKVAAAVAWAEALQRAGRPAVPLFWLGDDDDDWREALAPRIPDPRRGLVLAADPRPRPAGMLGRAGCAAVAAGAARWLREQAGRNRLAASLADLWAEAVRADWPWARLQRWFWLELFGDRGLLVLRGDDPHLAAAAAPLLGEWAERQDALLPAVAARGRRLADAGLGLPLGDAALARPWHEVDDAGRRLAATRPRPAALAAGRVRPGVVWRSPLQDALLRPAAVVVGPGEIAYLQQLAPLYAALGIPEPVRLPRLFARVGGTSGGTANASAAGDDAAAAAARRLAQRAAADLERELAAAGLPAAEASRRARQAAQRWELICRRHLAAQRPAAPPPVRAPWEPPPGGPRQERWLAAGWALAWWGDALPAAVNEAAARHAAGTAWRDWHLAETEATP